MKKKTKKYLSIGLIILSLIVVSALLINKGSPFATGTLPSYIQVPKFGYYECAPATKTLTSSWTTISNYNGVSDVLRCPTNTDKCTFSVRGESTNILTRRISYRVCPSFNTLENECNTPVNVDVGTGSWFSDNGRKRIEIPGTWSWQNKILVKYEKCVGASIGGTCLGVWQTTSGSEWSTTYTPFILWFTSPMTGRHEYTTLTQGCKFPTSDTSNGGYTFPGVGKLIDSITNVKGYSLSQTSTSDYEMEPFKTRNVIESFDPLSVDNVQFVTYGGKEGYCLMNTIYSIATVTTNAGTSKIVDTNFNNVLASGLECCPQDKEPTRKCGSDFKWHDIVNAECSAYNPCQGVDWYPSSAKTLIRYNCVSGKCVGQTKSVECTNNIDCVGNSKGSVCDTMTWTCSGISPPLTNGTCPDACSKDLDCFNCGDDFKCVGEGLLSKGKCEKVEVGTTEKCASCTAWATNIFKSSDKKCTADSYIKPSWSWNPLSWVGAIPSTVITATGLTSQNIICPFVILIGAIIIFIIILLIIILFGAGFTITKIFGNLFKKKRK